MEKYPACKQAFLPKGKALKKGNVGVENAKPEDIIEALENAHCTNTEQTELYTKEDLFRYGLVGTDTAKEKREKNYPLTETEETYLRIYEKKKNEIMWRDIEFYQHMTEQFISIDKIKSGNIKEKYAYDRILRL